MLIFGAWRMMRTRLHTTEGQDSYIKLSNKLVSNKMIVISSRPVSCDLYP
jgi:hypothetical protein